MITPTQEQFRSWSIDKTSQYSYESPASESSSGTYFDAEEKIRISAAMEDIGHVLKEQMTPSLEQEYQSSEEALSPMLDEETTGAEDDYDEDEDEDEDDDDDDAEERNETQASWTELEPYRIDVAVAICIAAPGKAHVVNVPQRWSTLNDRQSYLSNRSSSPSPTRPARTTARSIPLHLNTELATRSAHESLSSASSYCDTPESLCQEKTPASSSHCGMPSTASMTSFDPSASTPSFLESDPYETTQPRPGSTTRSRLRSISSKFRSATSTPGSEQPVEKETKQKRRRSVVGSTPAAGSELPPFFFSQRARDQWYREHATSKSESASPRSATPSALAGTPVQRSFPKMVARGANEREPTIELPPCPKDYDQDVPALTSPQRRRRTSLSREIHSSSSMKTSSSSTVNLLLRQRRSTMALRGA
ncbi:uncharacterized protein PV09_02025 [Verruconis gallopava]|uniref:Uncharacterized protein n=1 Tax=Verruconis gallopava TaxID=253628 RepID=A0A0D1XWJ9_9PEZI|nr:uncharacterized protein PV09_02025 [Verruconis gallopava]KIW07156.1 hypothetical protein PV09_02025 [Verruconis gallopava]